MLCLLLETRSHLTQQANGDGFARLSSYATPQLVASIQNLPTNATLAMPAGSVEGANVYLLTTLMALAGVNVEFYVISLDSSFNSLLGES